MKLIKVSIELIIDDDLINADDISTYLNNKLYNDPGFFGDFGPENIIGIKDFE